VQQFLTQKTDLNAVRNFKVILKTSYGKPRAKIRTFYWLLSKIKKNEIGRACGAYGGGERCAQGFGGEA
jgi:hypothetical protein